MSKQVRTLVVRDGADPQHPFDVSSQTIPATLKAYYELIGSDIVEAVRPHPDAQYQWVAYCDEEGKMKRRPINAFATALAWWLGWPPGDVLVGTVVFLGPFSGEGEDTNVPATVEHHAEILAVDWPKWQVR